MVNKKDKIKISKYSYTFSSYPQYLKSNLWKELKHRKFESSNFSLTCEFCNSDCDQLDTHHLFYRPKWEDSKIEDLVRICKTCHEKVHRLQKQGKLKISKDFKYSADHIRQVSINALSYKITQKTAEQKSKKRLRIKSKKKNKKSKKHLNNTLL